MKSRKFSLLLIICLSFALMINYGGTLVQANTIVSSGTFRNDFKWTLDSNNTLILSGVGCPCAEGYQYPSDSTELEIAYSEEEAFRQALNQTKKLIVKEGITRLFDPGGSCFFFSIKVEEVQLPASMDQIGGFENCKKLKKVKISDASTATVVVEQAFYGCEQLSQINLPNTTTRIGENAFRECKMLTQIDLPDSVQTIDDRAFCDTGITEITIPASVKFNHGFIDSSIEDVVFLPKKVNKDSFYGASSVNTIVFGKKLSSMNNRALDDCDSLKNVVFLNDYDYNSKVFDNLSDVVVYRNHNNKQVTLEEASSGTKNVIVPSKVAGYKVTKIGEYAFDSNKYVRTVKLPSTIMSIEPYAFYNCSKLNRIKLRDGITKIGKFSFYGCNSMESIKLPDTLTTIGERAFWNCYSLTSLTIPPSVTIIGANSFESCTSLTTIAIGETVSNSVSELIIPTVYAGTSKKTTNIKIKKNAFKNCKKLRKVVIGSKVKSIGNSAFYKCSKLKTISIKTKKLKSNTIGAKAFKGISKNATFKVPKSKLITYKKILLKKGATTTMKFKTF